ncbi:MAG: hypothetical protein WC707_06305 [Candidatus Babeliaceae bacterium]|jgi:hypothetical protein
MKETESMSTYKKICNKILKEYHMIFILMLPGCSSMYNYHASQSATRIEQASCYNKKLHRDLLYNNKPIPDACMEKLTPRLSDQMPNELDLDTFIPEQDDAERDIYRWKYIGTLSHGPHLVYAHWKPRYGAGTFTEISIIRRIGNTLKIADNTIDGGEYASTSINDACTLDGDTLTYAQRMTNYSLLYDVIIPTYPELEEKLRNKQWECDLGSLWDRGGTHEIGYGTFEVTITEQDEFKNKHLISFTPVTAGDECWYRHDWLKNTPKASLGLGDAIRGIIVINAARHATFTIEQLKEMVLEALTYTAEKEE